jgi:transcriptional regulator with XRE-family HTH domain
MIALNAKKLAEERARKATQEDLAGQLEIKIGYISAAENDKPVPERAAEAIAKALGKSTLTLFKPITNALTDKRVRKKQRGSSSEIWRKASNHFGRYPSSIGIALRQ